MSSSIVERLVATEPAARERRHRLLVQHISHLGLRLRAQGRDLASTTGLANRELSLLSTLALAGPTSVKSLVADLGLPRSTMTAIVDRLERRGLVRRLPNPRDRRSVVVEPTPKASAALARYAENLSDLVDHIAHVLDESEQDELANYVRRISESL